ncbi:MAG: hypothetical protein HY682_12570, partial [Chloroflexi bacterium]|nr:hypothetical protein [Chloroflexota bacterium]
CAGDQVATPGPGGSPVPPGAPGIISGYDAVYFSLRGTGAQVSKSDEEVEQPFFSVPGRLLKVNGQDVQVFEYRSVSAAEEEAGKVSPDGTTIGQSSVMWASTPHFYRQANTIVLYVGDDVSVFVALQRGLGQQFAGHDNAVTQTIKVPAPIDDVAIELRERAPLSYVAVVQSGLPNSCVKFGNFDVQRDGNRFVITVSNITPTDPIRACLQVYGTVNTVITLPGPFEEGAAYEVEVNGKASTFIAGQETADAGNFKTVPAPIEEVSVAVLESFPVQYRLIVKSGLPNACVSFDGYAVQREGDLVRVTVTNKEPAEPAICAQVYKTVDTVINLGTGTDYEKGKTITVDVNGKLTSFVAQ